MDERQVLYALYYKRPNLSQEWFTGYFEETEEVIMNKVKNLQEKGFQVRVVQQVIITQTIGTFV